MSNQAIIIKGIKSPFNGDLILSDRGTDTRVEPTGNVTWRIGTKSGVGSITDIQPKNGTGDVFSIRPHAEGRIWTGKIKHDAPIDTEWHYTIWWKDINGDGPYPYDPKIAIKPPDFHLEIVQIILMVVGLISFYKIFSHRREKNRYVK